MSVELTAKGLKLNNGSVIESTDDMADYFRAIGCTVTKSSKNQKLKRVVDGTEITEDVTATTLTINGRAGGPGREEYIFAGGHWHNCTVEKTKRRLSNNSSGQTVANKRVQS